MQRKGDAVTQIVAEEMLLWGYSGLPGREEFLSHLQAKELLENARPTSDLPAESRWFDFLQPELTYLKTFNDHFDDVAKERSRHLVEAHERFSKVVGGSRFQIVVPVLPMDIMGLYVIVPDMGGRG